MKDAQKLDKSNVLDIINLTAAQEGILFQYLSNPDSEMYFEQVSLSLSGHIDNDIFRNSWNSVAENNEAFRTVFRWEGLKKPIQVILKKFDLPIRIYDFSTAGALNRDKLLDNIKSLDKSERVDITVEPYRVTLCKMDENSFEMFFSTHHILTDGWSTGIILKEFFAAYNNLANNDILIPKKKRSFKEYVRFLKSNDTKEQETYWKAYLDRLNPQITLQDISTKKDAEPGEGKYSVEIPSELDARLKRLLTNNKVTVATLYYFAWGALLHKYSGSKDIMFGTTVSGRDPNFKGIEDMVGLFINTIPLRFKASPAAGILELMKELQNDLNTRENYSSTPISNIRKYGSLYGRESIFDSIVVIDNYPLDKIVYSQQGPIKAVSYLAFEMTNFDLVLQAMVFEKTNIYLSYNRSLFSESFIERLMSHFLNLLEQIAVRPNVSLAELQFITDKEKNQILLEFNNTHCTYPSDKTIHQLFEEKAAETPESVALIQGYERISYGELNRKSNQLAALLRQRGVGPDSIVGVVADRSIEMLIGIYGILKARGAYLPIDPRYPAERIQYMLHDSGASILLTQEEYTGRLDYEGQIINISDTGIYTGSEENPACLAQPGNLAYMIYTSGSTGKPKAVMINHGSVVNLLNELQKSYPVYETDSYLFKTSFTFDVSVSEIFGWFLGKGRLVILEKDGEKDPTRIIAAVKEHGVTHVNFVPSMLNTMLNVIDAEGAKMLSSLKYVIAAGEALPKEVARKYFELIEGASLENVYGPTESTVYATRHSLSNRIDTQTIPIGKPFGNLKAYILDEHNNLQPVGIAGELYLAGEGLARGYKNKQELTAERFVENPFSIGERMYRTGDIARWLEDGNIEYLGRVDNQVKIRGYRIELGEIESTLLKNEMVKEAAVVAKGELSSRYLCAYIVCDNGLKDEELRQFMLGELPEYMVPACFVRLDKLIYIWSGKVDRNALAALKIEMNPNEIATVPYNEVQDILYEIYKEILERHDFGINENFFDLGGNSLLIMQMHKKIQNRFNTKLTIAEMFQYPTISSVARYLSEETEQKNHKEKAMVPAIYNPQDAAGKQADIAIIGMSGRFPKAGSIDELWRNLCSGLEAISFFTDDELKQSNIGSETIKNPNYVKAWGVLDDIEMFDAGFFGYSPREAESLDPQQRIFLECSYNALEDAGYANSDSDCRIGVFAGVSMSSYAFRGYTDKEILASIGRFQLMLGNDKDFLSTRTSYKLNLRGPSVTVQTACSTSLVAVHMACMSLLANDADIVLAGGVSIKTPQKEGYFYTEGGILSPDGHCRAFDADARGTVGGSGAAVVVLKRYDEAVRDGDNIYAVIKGTAINNDGSNKVGFTAPSVEGQVDVIKIALEKSGVSQEAIGYIETHGTGTQLGDPIEVAALTKAYRQYTDKKGYCAIGSIKTNLGHLDAAAGIVGLVKATLCLKHKTLVPSINYNNPNPNIDFDNSPFYVNTGLSDWNTKEALRYAAVSSFGIGGTNAHVVLEEARAACNKEGVRKKRNLLVLSARSVEVLDKLESDVASYFRQNPEISMSDAAYTLQVGRKPHEYRRYLACISIDEAINLMENKAQGKANTIHCTKEEPHVVYMFTGQGAQYVNMARELYNEEPIFRSSLDSCCEILKSEMGTDIRELLYPSEENIDISSEILAQTSVTQPALFAIEYAIARLWQYWGIKPWAFIGHSIGEYVAACISGVFSLNDALRLVAARGRLMQSLPTGSMLAVGLSEAAAKAYVNESISLAAVNAPDLCVLSGIDEEVDRLERELEQKGVFHNRLKTSHAFHSSMVEPILDEFRKSFSETKLNKPGVPFISCTTGTWITEQEVADPSYWVRHLRESVRFSDGITELLKRKDCILLEVGPGKTLASLARQHKCSEEAVILYSLPNVNEQYDDCEFVLSTLGQLWGNGAKVNWNAFNNGASCRRISLPAYPFDRKYYWLCPSQGGVSGCSEQICETGETYGYKKEEESKKENLLFHERPHMKNKYVAPSNMSEKTIAAIWEEFLGIRPIGVTDNFFELGGHSLMATQIIAQIRDIFKVDLPLQAIFNTPTINEIVNVLYLTWQDKALVEEIASVYQEADI
jgi:amino acid adenylation domain-containing protein